MDGDHLNVNVDFLDGELHIPKPVIVVDAFTVKALIDSGEHDDLVEILRRAVNALEVTGKRIIYVHGVVVDE